MANAIIDTSIKTSFTIKTTEPVRYGNGWVESIQIALWDSPDHTEGDSRFSLHVACYGHLATASDKPNKKRGDHNLIWGLDHSVPNALIAEALESVEDPRFDTLRRVNAKELARRLAIADSKK